MVEHEESAFVVWLLQLLLVVIIIGGVGLYREFCQLVFECQVFDNFVCSSDFNNQDHRMEANFSISKITPQQATNSFEKADEFF